LHGSPYSSDKTYDGDDYAVDDSDDGGVVMMLK